MPLYALDNWDKNSAKEFYTVHHYQLLVNDLSNILGTARIVNYNITGMVDIRSDGEQKKLERVNTDYIIDAKLF